MATNATIGDVRITALVDVAPPPFAPQDFFPDVPLSAWHAHDGALDSDGKFRTNFGVFLLQAPDATLLVDTGAGPGAIPGADSKLLEGIQGAGVNLADISAVVFTHLHSDHIGWAVTPAKNGDPRPTFLNAEYIVSIPEWDYWTSPEVMAETPEIEMKIIPLQDHRQIRLSDDETVVVDGIRTVATPGHTPGHQSLFIESSGQRGLIAGDLLHSSVQFTESDWCAGFDMDKDEARASRKKWIEKAAADRMTVAAGHLLLDDNIGQVVQLNGRHRWKSF